MAKTKHLPSADLPHKDAAELEQKKLWHLHYNRTLHLAFSSAEMLLLHHYGI